MMKHLRKIHHLQQTDENADTTNRLHISVDANAKTEIFF